MTASREQSRTLLQIRNLMTLHAAVRLQQRGICRDVLDCLLRYGQEVHDHRGAVVMRFDKRAVLALRRSEPPGRAREVEDARNVYAVVGSDGRVLTTGHRFSRLMRDRGLANMRPRRRGESKRFA